MIRTNAIVLVPAVSLLGSTLLADRTPLLLGHWPLIADARDISGNNHDGVVKSGAVFSPDAKLKMIEGL